MLRRALLKLRNILPFKMASVEQTKVGEKRTSEDVGANRDSNSKKAKSEVQPGQQGRDDRKRKCALLIAYNGKGYYGIQINPGFQTIESELCKALLEVGLIPQEHHDCMQKMSFQRAARTDKNVSAAGNVVSLKMLLNVDDLVGKLNEKLPPRIRVMDYVRTTNGFSCKNYCDARTYIYVLPTYAFAPVEEKCTLDYRTNLDIIEKVNEVLEKFKGTHYFHNFTAGVKPTDGQAQRYIQEFECRLPLVRDGVEFCVIAVRGQSFMLHQIRKMIGLTIAIVKGLCGIEAIEEAWKHEKMDVPKAPGLGLILDKLHYTRYNETFGSDGVHKKIEWSHIKDKLEEFKENQIFSEIIKQEIAEQSMMSWLSTLHNHSFSTEEHWWYKRKSIANTLYGKDSQAVDESPIEPEGELQDSNEKPANQKEEETSSSNQEATSEISSNQMTENETKVDCASDNNSVDNKTTEESQSDKDQSDEIEPLKSEAAKT